MCAGTIYRFSTAVTRTHELSRLAGFLWRVDTGTGIEVLTGTRHLVELQFLMGVTGRTHLHSEIKS